jgi:hypothetical protein
VLSTGFVTGFVSVGDAPQAEAEFSIQFSLFRN